MTSQATEEPRPGRWADVQGRDAGELDGEVERLRRRLEEAEDTIRAIHNGEVDAFVVSVMQRDRVFMLQTAERPYRMLVERMQLGAAAVDRSGTVLYCNRSFARLLGVDRKTVYSMAQRRKLPGCRRVGRCIRFSRDRILEWLADDPNRPH